MTRIKATAARTFSSLHVPNYRLYFIGQVISMAGTWMQSMAQIWLVYELTGSAAALGIVTALQFTPVLILGMWGGVVADRFDKRKVIIGTQSAAAVLAVALGLATVTGTVQLWMIYALAFGLGCVNLIEVPTRQSFVVEMVGPEFLSNAIGLNSTVFTSARIIGPAIGGVVIAMFGVSWCFFINAVTFMAVIAGLLRMNPDELHTSPPVARAKGQLREGIRYVWNNPPLRTALGMMAVVGTLAFNFRVLLPVMATEFNGGAGTYGALSAFMGGGTLLGALFAASRVRPARRTLILSALAYGVLILIAGIAPTLPLELIALIPMGAAGIAFISTANSTLQLNSSDEMRGRVMAIYSVVFLGSTPIGSPIAGWSAEQFGVRAGFFISGVPCVLAAAWALRAVWNERVAAGRAADLETEAEIETPEDAAHGGGAPSLQRLRTSMRYALRR